MSQPFKKRRKQLTRKLSKLGVEALLITSEVNVGYLTGFLGDSSWLLLGKDHAVIISDGRFTEQLASDCPDIEAHIRGTGESMRQSVGNVAKASGFGSIAFESSHLSYEIFSGLSDELPNVQWNPQTGLVEELRAIKDAGEIELIRQAVRLAERTFTVTRAQLMELRTEKEVADGIEMTIRQLGGSGSSFPPIVAVGPNSALPHALPGQAVLGSSDFLLIDWGARRDGYVSDLTRMVVTRKLTRKFAKAYEHVLTAQQRAIDLIAPGVTTGAVDNAARAYLEDNGHGKHFNHSLGHGIGRQVHEGPGLRQQTDTELKPGMVVTVEPGVYLPGWGGIRIEDDVLVTKDGHEVLSSVPKELDDILLQW